MEQPFHYRNLRKYIRLAEPAGYNHYHCYRDDGAGRYSEPCHLSHYFITGKNPYDRIVKIHGVKGQEYSAGISLSRRTDHFWRHSTGRFSRLADLLASGPVWLYHITGRLLFHFHCGSQNQLAAGLLGQSRNICVCFVVLLIPSFFIIKRLSPVKAISFN